MNFDQIAFHLEHSSTIKLLRSDYASLALGFFHFAFKQQHRAQIPFNELKQILGSYLEGLSENSSENTNSTKNIASTISTGSTGANAGNDPTFGGKKFTNNPEHYLNMWCSDNHRFIRKFYDYESDTPIVELTYDSERALEWMENLERKEFVGTHSRFTMIFENLQTIANETDVTPSGRLKFLEEKKNEITDEMKTIKTTGVVKKMDGTLIRERFLNLIEDSRRLISDFCLVEDIFKDLTQKIKEEKLKEFVTKGEILGQILDAYDYLEESDQGKSFNAFWNFLMSSSRQSELNELIRKALSSPEIENFIQQTKNHHYSSFLKKFKANLLHVGQKVLKSKFRLSEELRKLLHQKYLLENKHVSEEIFQIKRFLIENKEFFLNRPPKDFIALNYLPEIDLPMERPLWQSKEATIFADTSSTDNSANSKSAALIEEENKAIEKEMALLKEMYFIDRELLATRIEKALTLTNKGQISLGELSLIFPIERGIGEIVGYMDLAKEHTDNCFMHDDVIESISLHIDSLGDCSIKTPQVIFTQASFTTNA
ncbi:MAG: DUF3375 domain-containing protein [Oligoflexia bacterium]|nr:DUF3375 domain-containing protein [Oligoflexia bacterium]